MSLLQGLINDLPSLPVTGTQWKEPKQENNDRDIQPR
jgi:hypothetical protein